MKKFLLFAGVLSGIGSFSQSFTVNDTLYTGLSTTYYVLDSNAVDHNAVTGSGVTWNYSTILGYSGLPTNSDIVGPASASPYTAHFPTSQYNDNMANGVSLFFSNSADSMTVHGFVFNADGNDVIMKHNTNPLKVMTFPLSVGGTFSDVTSGEVVVGTYPAAPTNGTTTVTVDGFGTLNVGVNSHTNITRVKLVETITASLPFPFTSGTVTRTVYSYYDFANDKQPILVHATIIVDTDILSDDYTAVYYSGLPSFASVEENPSNVFSIYPNPANSIATLSTDGTADNLYIINALGQVVYALTNPKSIETVDVSNFEKGIYIVQVTKGDATTNQKLIVE